MEATGVCSICGKAGILYPCSMCGARACRDCITLRGVCKPCMGGRTMTIDDFRNKGLDSK
ncbi:MAG: orotate phosphoribosyltransferase [Candidatus Altiarchaeota archaeon]|nr:orotate phosphoribosyltransferase [Candidatus Altiarchaeota archaeon]